MLFLTVVHKRGDIRKEETVWNREQNVSEEREGEGEQHDEDKICV